MAGQALPIQHPGTDSASAGQEAHGPASYKSHRPRSSPPEKPPWTSACLRCMVLQPPHNFLHRAGGPCGASGATSALASLPELGSLAYQAPLPFSSSPPTSSSQPLRSTPPINHRKIKKQVGHIRPPDGIESFSRLLRPSASLTAPFPILYPINPKTREALLFPRTKVLRRDLVPPKN